MDELRRRGAQVHLVPVYRTVIAGEKREELLRALRRRPAAVAFTSSSAVRHFVELVGASQCAGLIRGVRVACLGEITARAARDCGLAPDIVPSQSTLENLAAAIVHFLRR